MVYPSAAMRARVPALVVCACAMVGFIACDDTMTPKGVGLVRTDLLPYVAVSPIVPIVTPAGTCYSVAYATGVNVVVTAGNSSVRLDQVTFQLIDGSNIGGESVTFPQGGLSTQFGDTLVGRTQTRSFPLTPYFGCASYRPYSVRTDVVVIDELGASQTMSSTSRIP